MSVTGRFRIGLDIGGTFTDLAVYDNADDSLLQIKTLSSEDPVDCVTAGVTKAAAHFRLDRRTFLGAVDHVFCFGTTHGLNTLLTQRGSKVGIVTTKGHGDAYAIAQMDRQGIHDIRDAVEGTFRPLVPRACIRELQERVDYSGRVVVPLNEDQARDAVRELVEGEGVEALVVAFLWSHKEPCHERRVAEMAGEMYPGLFVTAGSDISGVLGEFTRLSTAVINGYIGKRVQTQANRLRELLADEGLRVPILVMQMLGGVAPVDDISKRPVALLKSGPVGGTVAAAAVAEALGEPNLVCLDMGGTSLDVSRITQGEMELSRGFTILRHPIALPGVEIESVGAGGGSVAILEEAGGLARLRVGPESAGSSPGPVCYGRGGDRPTVTDANLILGILNPTKPLGGEIQLDRERARAVVSDAISRRLGETVVESAWGIYQVITAQMADAVERFMVSRGVDPRQHALVAFGAAAPAHALAIGARLGSPKVIVPAASPVFSAYGLMTTDVRHAYEITDDSVRFPIRGSEIVVGSGDAERVRARLESVSERPQQLLEREEIELVAREIALYVDMRYSGQELQLAIEVPSELMQEASATALDRVVAAWRDKYDQVYGAGASWSEGAVEIVNYRAVAVGRLAPVRTNGSVNGSAPATQTVVTETRQVYLGEPHDASVHHADALTPGMRVSGPAVIEGDLTTLVLGPGDELDVDPSGNWIAIPAPTGWRW